MSLFSNIFGNDHYGGYRGSDDDYGPTFGLDVVQRVTNPLGALEDTISGWISGLNDAINKSERDFAVSSAERANNFSAAEAEKDRLFQQSSAEQAMKFSADEAEKSRQWQEEMSNTAFQRGIADMKAAGLNPILAYSQGSAATTSGATATGISASGSSASASRASTSSSANVITIASQMIANTAPQLAKLFK